MSTREIFITVHGCDESSYFTIELADAELKALQKVAAATLHEEVHKYSCHPVIEVSTVRPEYGFGLPDSLYKGYEGDEYSRFDASGELIETIREAVR